MCPVGRASICNPGIASGFDLRTNLRRMSDPGHVGAGPSPVQVERKLDKFSTYFAPSRSLLDPKVFLKLLQLDLNAHPPGAPIAKINLSVEPVRPRSTQSGLFLPPSPEPEKLELTLAQDCGNCRPK